MELTQRQCETIYHLKYFQKIEGKDQIIAWAKKKLQEKNYRQRARRHKVTINTRKHSIEYYQQIISYFESNGSSIEQLDR